MNDQKSHIAISPNVKKEIDDFVKANAATTGGKTGPWVEAILHGLATGRLVLMTVRHIPNKIALA